jgi:hypothetical protein
MSRLRRRQSVRYAILVSFAGVSAPDVPRVIAAIVDRGWSLVDNRTATATFERRFDDQETLWRELEALRNLSPAPTVVSMVERRR